MLRTLSSSSDDVSNAIRRLSDKIESLGILSDKESSDGIYSPGNKVVSFPSPSGLEMSTPDLYRRNSNVEGPKMKAEAGAGRENENGTASAPQVFFNESFIGGGEDEILALERKDELDEKLKEVFEYECPETAPQPPVYGENDPENSKFDNFTEVITKIKSKIVMKDKFHKMRLFSRCFAGSEAVDAIVEERSCSMEETVLLGRELAAKHFFHHVLR